MVLFTVGTKILIKNFMCEETFIKYLGFLIRTDNHRMVHKI